MGQALDRGTISQARHGTAWTIRMDKSADRKGPQWLFRSYGPQWPDQELHCSHHHLLGLLLLTLRAHSLWYPYHCTSWCCPRVRMLILLLLLPSARQSTGGGGSVEPGAHWSPPTSAPRRVTNGLFRGKSTGGGLGWALTLVGC